MISLGGKKIEPVGVYSYIYICDACRLISLGGKKIEPVGVDYILQKLGFQHARLTIPKWIQRGYMDPLDYILSVLTKQLIKVLEEDKVSTQQATTGRGRASRL